MAVKVTLPTVLATLAAGNQPASLIDGDFNAITAALAELGTYSNYLLDTGGANAYVVVLAAGYTGALANGLTIQMKAVNANTAASTLNYNSTGALPIINLDGSALSTGEIPASAIVTLVYSVSAASWLLVTPFLTTLPTNSTTTFTLTGCTTSPTYVGKWTKQGNVVTLSFPGTSVITGTSNSTSKALTGMPAALYPSATIYAGTGYAADNGGGGSNFFTAQVTSVGVINLSYSGNNIPSVLTSWTAANLFAIYAPTFSWTVA